MTKSKATPKPPAPHFKFISAITYTKQDILEDEKEYDAFMVNRGLSYYMDTMEKANNMNMNSHLDTRLQFDYLINTVRSYKRPYTKWSKRKDEDDLKLVMEYYHYNVTKAKTALSILSADQITIIKELMASKE